MKHEVSSLRLPEPVAKQLRSIAQANGISVAEVLRQAIESHVTEQVSAGEFKERLRKRMEEDREVLDALGTDE